MHTRTRSLPNMPDPEPLALSAAGERAVVEWVNDIFSGDAPVIIIPNQRGRRIKLDATCEGSMYS